MRNLRPVLAVLFLAAVPACACSAGACGYPRVVTSCPFGCSDGHCLSDPCGTLACNSPPSSNCLDCYAANSFAPSGTCAKGACSYASTSGSCANGCDQPQG